MVTTTPDRVQEIIAEARRRVADSGGKASSLPAMIERVTNEFRMRDQQTNQFQDRVDYEMPNNMEAYIDRVLQMSGMTGSGSSVPTPTPRPDGDMSAPVDPVERGGALADAAPNPDNKGATVADKDSLMADFAKWAAIGGTAYAAYKLYQKYGKTVDSSSNLISDMPNADTGGTDDKSARVTTPEVQQQLEAEQRRMIPHMPDSAAITDEGTPRLPPSSVDESIASTLGDDEFDRRFQADIEGRSGVDTRTGPNRFNTGADDAVLAEVERLAKSGDVRGAVNYARQNGVELTDEMMQALAEGSNLRKSLSDRLGDVVGPTIQNAIRQAVR